MTMWDYAKDHKPGAPTAPTWASLELHGLSVREAQHAIENARMEKDDAIRRGREIREAREARLRAQGYTEEQIKRMG